MLDMVKADVLSFILRKVPYPFFSEVTTLCVVGKIELYAHNSTNREDAHQRFAEDQSPREGMFMALARQTAFKVVICSSLYLFL